VLLGAFGGAFSGYGVIVEKQTAALTRLDAVEKRLDKLDVVAARLQKLDTKLDLLIELNQQAKVNP
jgi:uncharacterized protein YydD (DUF2326 family)